MLFWTAVLWVNSKNLTTSGTGKANGYGYHKPSAAVAEAIKNAGIELSFNISGVGNSAIKEAMIAIAELIGHPEALLVYTFQ